MTALLTIRLRNEHDVVTARRKSRELAAELGFDAQDQSRIATAVSEIARNAVGYGGGGTAELSVNAEAEPARFEMRIADQGPGIEDLDRILSGRYRSKTGMGLGLVGAQRLLDGLDVRSAAGEGTVVQMWKNLPRKSAGLQPEFLRRIAEDRAKRPDDLLAEDQQQSQDLLRALEELTRRQQEFEKLNAELEDTNRGVVALTAELDDKAEQLKQADQMKSRFLSHMSHEFRTPLNSILALCRLLQDQIDGPLAPEQQKQVGFIRRSAENLFELVNDLLDLAKVEAGKTDVRVSDFEAANIFGALRGVMKPLLTNENVALTIEDASEIPPLQSDEGKIGQILRNFTSNALKFTERGEVRVFARYSAEDDTVTFSVSDTGIGIAPADVQRIFEEFGQVQSAVQSRVKGTGLGLPLSRKLTELLGGRVSLESEPGKGSTFSATIPRIYSGADLEERRKITHQKPVLLIADDEEIARYLIRQAIGPLPYDILEASDGLAALRLARQHEPSLIFLDLLMPHKNGFEVIQDLKGNAATARIPIVVVSSKVLTTEERATVDGAAAAFLSKEVLSQASGPKVIVDMVQRFAGRDSSRAA